MADDRSSIDPSPETWTPSFEARDDVVFAVAETVAVHGVPTIGHLNIAEQIVANMERWGVIACPPRE